MARKMACHEQRRFLMARKWHVTKIRLCFCYFILYFIYVGPHLIRILCFIAKFNIKCPHSYQLMLGISFIFQIESRHYLVDQQRWALQLDSATSDSTLAGEAPLLVRRENLRPVQREGDPLSCHGGVSAGEAEGSVDPWIARS